MAKIKDMGEYIPGAKKELWSKGNIDVSDISIMSEGDIDKYIKRDIIFPKPDYQQMVEDGMAPWIALFISKVRGLIIKEPRIKTSFGCELYLRAVSNIKVLLAGVSTEEDVIAFRKLKVGQLCGMDDIEDFEEGYCFDKSSLRIEYTLRYRLTKTRLYYEAENKGFGQSKEIRSQKTAERRRQEELDSFAIIKNCPENIKFETYGKFKKMRLCLEHKRQNGSTTYYIYDEKDFILSEYETGKCTVIYCKKGLRNKIYGKSFTEDEANAFVEAKVEANLKEAESSKKSERKKKFSVCTVNMVRNGYDYVADLNAHLGVMEEKSGPLSWFFDNIPEYHPNESDFTETFMFKGIQFGNWESDQDRKENLKWLYNSCKDLCKLLNIEERDISFGGDLSIAFGARGSKGASAHYEPGYKVINLTKMKGAGCFVHEWAHALDNNIAKVYGLKHSFMSEAKYEWLLPDAFCDVIKSIKGSRYSPTEYMKDSQCFDKIYTSAGNGYWSSMPEMFARALDCYIVDKMKEVGMVNSFLSAHAESFHTTYEGKEVYAYPRGEERKKINEAFDEMFLQLARDRHVHVCPSEYVKTA